jgi:anthrone oxygenase-like protein
MFAEIVALICTSLFAGAALYVSVVEHPARLACSTDVALAEWRPSYKRAAVMQVILAIVGVGSAVAAYMSGRGTSVLVAGIVLATVVPWTLIIIMPTNRQLLDPTRLSSTPDTDLLLKKWGRLHTIRTVASLLALAILAGNILGYL